MADQFDTFKQEIEEDLQRERMLKLWEQYKTYIVGVAIAIPLAVLAYVVFQNQRLASIEARGAEYAAAAKLIADKKPDDAVKALAAIGASSTGYAALANLRLAGVHAEAGRKAEAAAAYEAVQKQSGVDPLIADLARLQSAMLMADSIDFTELQNRLNPLLTDSHPWRNQARELVALSAIKANRNDDARVQLDRLLGDKELPGGMREHVTMLMAIVTQADLAKAQQAAQPAAPAPAAPAAAPAKEPAAKADAPKEAPPKKK